MQFFRESASPLKRAIFCVSIIEKKVIMSIKKRAGFKPAPTTTNKMIDFKAAII